MRAGGGIVGDAAGRRARRRRARGRPGCRPRAGASRPGLACARRRPRRDVLRPDPTRSATRTRSSTRRRSTGSRPGSFTTVRASGPPIAFPIDAWFRIRVVFAGRRAEIFVGDTAAPALEVGELKRPVVPGGIGLLAGGPAVHVAGFGYGEAGEATFRRPAPPPPTRVAGVVPAWWVSDPFPKPISRARRSIPASRIAIGSRLESEPTGLVDLRGRTRSGATGTPSSRGRRSGRRGRTTALEVGFSDRAVVYLNGACGLPWRRHVSLAGLPLPGEHRVLRHALPAARRGRQRARDRRLRDVRRLGRAGAATPILRPEP